MKRIFRPLLWLALALLLTVGLSATAFAGNEWYNNHPLWVATHSDPHFDITVRPDDPMTVEEFISLTTARSYWAVGDTVGTDTPRDRNGDLPSDWAAPYIRYYSGTFPTFDPARVDYDAPATLGFMMRFFASLKGLYSFDANNIYSFTGTQGYSTEETLLLSVAVDYGIVPYQPDMDVSVANLLRRDLETKYLIPEGQLTIQRETIQTSTCYRNSLIFFEDTYDYGSWAKPDAAEKKWHELENIKALGDNINMVDMNIQVLNRDGSSGSFLLEDRVPMSPVHGELMRYCKEQGIKVLCGVLNYYDGTTLQALKDDPSKVEKLADELVGYVDKYEFDGLDMDIEMLGNTYRAEYSALLRALSVRMRARNKPLVGTVGAYFTEASERNSLYDYDVIRETCDLVMIILYDDHSARAYRESSYAVAGCLSSYDGIRRRLTYAVSRLGAEKILMSVGTYGVDFDLDKHQAVALTRQEINALLRNYNAVPAIHDPLLDDTYFTYLDADGDRHEVYYDSDEGLSHRLGFVTQYGLAGICVFYAVSDTPEFFEMIGEGLTDLPFNDVGRGWFYDSVRWAVKQGVTTGTSPTAFSPENTCTRAQVVTFLWRANGSPAPENAADRFTDVLPDAYYAKAVAWAAEHQITSGTSRTAFSPNAGCTRGQVVTFLWRAEGCPEPESTGNP
ncbi:MAG: S-layer homology domain-containing protein, partial [Oscillospiraceae bacterium]|nr:S-layer homology domain-containing protein [Oscillospiraceae bacterium]